MSKSKVKKKEDALLPGQFTAVLTEEFVVATQTEGYDQQKVKLPFLSKQLPSQEEVIKLFLFLRQVAGPKNRFIQDVDLIQIITNVCKRYWEMAGFPTLTEKNIKEKLKKLVSVYREQKRNESRSTEVMIARREEFRREVKKLFNIASQDIEKKLGTDWIRKNLNVVEEDLKCYEDQKTERKMILGALDKSYLTKTQARDERKRKAEERKSEAITSGSLQDLLIDDQEDFGDEQKEPDENESEDEEPERKKKKSEFVTLQVPRDIFRNPGLCKMMDRGKITANMGVGMIAATLKSCKTPDGQDVNLNDFTLSRNSVQRKQAEIRQENLQNITKSVQDAGLSRLSIHWDGKKLKNSDGETYEAEVILVSGSPDYVEGKILGKFVQLLISHYNSTFTQMLFT